MTRFVLEMHRCRHDDLHLFINDEEFAQIEQARLLYLSKGTTKLSSGRLSRGFNAGEEATDLHEFFEWVNISPQINDLFYRVFKSPRIPTWTKHHRWDLEANDIWMRINYVKETEFDPNYTHAMTIQILPMGDG